MRLYLLSVFTSFFILLASLQIKAQKLAIVPYVSGINAPVDLKHCGDDRLFVADRGGLIRIINADGSLRPAPFLDISSKVPAGAGQIGLLGLAFSPNYKTDRKFYVRYAAMISGVATVFVEEYKVSITDSNVADISSALTLLTKSSPTVDDLGGNLMFGKDGYLYINIGDGGSGDEGQYKTTFLGKILRVDISNSSTLQPYAIPSSNPFYNDPTPNIKKEIWAYGLRNPYRSSFDRLTGDLLIADVGLYKVEEVNFQNANAPGGENYGWDIVEGDSCFNPSSGCDKNGITLPIYEYFHNGGPAAVIGGYVYRSAQSKTLWGQYIFADFISKWIDAFYLKNGKVSGNVNQLITPSQATGNPISFGEDRFGEQYVIFNGDGTIYKLEDTSFLRRPKAYFTPVNQGAGLFLLQGFQGRNLTYQWLRNNNAITGATSPDFSTSVTGNYSLVVTNDLNFSDTSDIFALSGALPLNLITFNAQRLSGKNIELQWKTALEQNITGFSILRKQNNESSFTNIGYVQSKSLNGFSYNVLDYQFADSSASINSTIFYRLQIRNTDGSLSYSDVRTINLASNNIRFEVYPNPAKGKVQIYMTNFTQPVVMMIYDYTGKKVKEQSLNQQSTIIDLSGLSGIYIVQVGYKDGSNVIRSKLVIQH